MRYQDLSNGKTLMEDIDNLDVSARSPKEIKKQGFFKRLLKKMTAATFLGLIGLAGGPIGAVLGASIGALLSGGKNRVAKIKDAQLPAFMKERGIDKQLQNLFNTYFSDNALQPFVNIGPAIGKAYTDQQLKTFDDGRANVLKNTDHYQLQNTKEHLTSAGHDLTEIAKQQGLELEELVYMFSKMYGDTPMNIFMKKVIGRKGK